jgi:hypothetical protein
MGFSLYGFLNLVLSSFAFCTKCSNRTVLPAEEGCLQYFTGVSGQIKSYNYDPAAGLQLSKQDYSICIRMERNFCGIQYTACPDAGIVQNN